MARRPAEPIFAVIVVGCMTFLMLRLVFYPYPKVCAAKKP